MADLHIDIERMIMHSNYLLEVNESSASEELSDRKIAELQAQLDKLAGEVKARRRQMHGKNNEKQTGDKSVKTGKTKDEEEEDYIENGCEQPSLHS